MQVPQCQPEASLASCRSKEGSLGQLLAPFCTAQDQPLGPWSALSGGACAAVPRLPGAVCWRAGCSLLLLSGAEVPCLVCVTRRPGEGHICSTNPDMALPGTLGQTGEASTADTFFLPQ